LGKWQKVSSTVDGLWKLKYVPEKVGGTGGKEEVEKSVGVPVKNQGLRGHPRKRERMLLK